MLVLAIDTATPAITAGLATVDTASTAPVAVRGERVTLDPRAHGELLMSHVLAAATDAGQGLSEVDAIVCGIGPGPFTGLRAGMVTAAALAHSLGVPAYPVCTLDAIAAQARPGEPMLAVTDARRREVYWAAYDGAGVRTEGPYVRRPAEIEHPAGLAAGHGVAAYAQALARTEIAPAYPSPHGLVAAAHGVLAAGQHPDPLTPLYLRRPDAAEPTAPKKVSAR